MLRLAVLDIQILNLELEACFLPRLCHRFFISVHVFVGKRIVMVTIAHGIMVINVPGVYALLILAFGADMLITLQLAISVLEGEAHGTRTRILALSLLLSKGDIWQIEMDIDSTDLKVVAMIQGDGRTACIELALVMQTIVTQDMDTEVTRVKVKKDLGMLP